MESEQAVALLIQVKGQVDEMHGVVYRNGLVSSVKEQQTQLQNINDKLNSFFITRDATCPYRAAVDSRAAKRRHKFDTRLVVYGLIIGALSNAPELIRAVLEVL